MKLVILYHPQGEYATLTEDFVKNIEQRTTRQVELLSLETSEGASAALNYDIVEYPAILVIREDGQIIKFWQGNNFPVLDEVIGNLNS